MCMDNLTDPQLEKDNSFLTILPNLEFAFPCFTFATRLISQNIAFSMSLLCSKAYSVHNIASNP